MEDLGGLEIWVNNVGIFPFAQLTDTTDEVEKNVMAMFMTGGTLLVDAGATA